MTRLDTIVATLRLALRAVPAILSFGLLLPTWLYAQPAPKPNTSSATAAADKSTASRTMTATRAPIAESGPCQIGVIPIAGNLFTIKKDGIVALADRRARISVDGWALDELVVSRVRAAAPGLSVRRIPFTREELQLAARTPQPLFSSRADNIKEFTKALAPRIKCDRYVVIHRDGGSVGFGIGMTGGSPTARAAILFALMSIRVYDGRSFELIAEGPARVTSDSVIDRAFHNSRGEPFRLVDAAAFPEKPADAVSNPVLRDGVRALLTASLDQTLPGLLQRSAQTPTR